MQWHEKAKGDTKKEVIDNTPRKSYHPCDYTFSRFCLYEFVEAAGTEVPRPFCCNCALKRKNDRPQERGPAERSTGDRHREKEKKAWDRKCT
jgi:hypothetical protein